MRAHRIYKYVANNNITLEDLNQKLFLHDAEIIIRTKKDLYNQQKIKSIESKRKLKRSMDIFFGIILEDLEDYILETRIKLDNLHGDTKTE